MNSQEKPSTETGKKTEKGWRDYSKKRLAKLKLTKQAQKYRLNPQGKLLGIPTPTVPRAVLTATLFLGPAASVAS